MCVSGLIAFGERVRFSCMSSFVRQTPEGDNRERLVSVDCGHVAYENPKVVVGSVVVADGRILMCRRAIEPRKGFWTLPAGYMAGGWRGGGSVGGS